MKRGFEVVKKEQLDANGLEETQVRLPKRATERSAGYDIFSPFGFSLVPGEEIIIPLGIKVYMLPDEYLAIHPRSGHGFKYYVRLANTTGIIDSDYYSNPKNDGHMFLKIRNESSRTYYDFILKILGKITGNKSFSNKNVMHVREGEAVCQGIFSKYMLVDSDNVTEKRNGGIGSTNG